MVEQQVKDYYQSQGETFERRDDALQELMNSGAVTVGSIDQLMEVLGGLVDDPEQVEALRKMAENAEVGEMLVTPIDEKKNDDQEDQQ
jgi:hypothetical protein